MATKRPHSDLDNIATNPSPSTPRAKRPHLGQATYPSSRAPPDVFTKPASIKPWIGADLLSPLSDELLIRILSFLPLPNLLATAPVSRRFNHLSEDSQLWKALYYARFVLPRAMRIPGFRDGPGVGGGHDHKLHYSGRRALWADGRRGGLVADRDEDKRVEDGRIRKQEEEDDSRSRVNWKGQYKLRHNWAKGKCAVEELKLGFDDAVREDGTGKKILAKVVEGLAVTADKALGLRAWDLKTREVLAQISLGNGEAEVAPSCIAIDDDGMARGILEISVGFVDGSFGIWILDLQDRRFTQHYQHEKSSNGELVGMAYSHPYLLTATLSVLISLYTFDIPEEESLENDEGGRVMGSETRQLQRSETESDDSEKPEQARRDSTRRTDEQEGTSMSEGKLPPPYLMTSLKSHSSDAPLALSIRSMAATTIASIAYTFSTRQGWAIGIQDLHITPSEGNIKAAPMITTRLAYTTPVSTGSPVCAPLTPPQTPMRSRFLAPSSDSPNTDDSRSSIFRGRGPTTLCYTHPYLLATLPDNTLILHMCTSTASALSVSPGIRLWGHTSGISDAEITARGKAVSVSSRGEEMRVWELEGKLSGLRSRSVEIRPGGLLARTTGDEGAKIAETDFPDWEERRNWVGFDDEMVIVLKESKGGRESLMVYDFT